MAEVKASWQSNVKNCNMDTRQQPMSLVRHCRYAEGMRPPPVAAVQLTDNLLCWIVSSIL